MVNKVYRERIVAKGPNPIAIMREDRLGDNQYRKEDKVDDEVDGSWDWSSGLTAEQEWLMHTAFTTGK